MWPFKKKVVEEVKQEEVKDDIFEHQKKVEDLATAQSRQKAEQVAELFNTLKRGCHSQDELAQRLSVVRELDKNFNWAQAEKELDLKMKSVHHAKEIIKVAKGTSEADIQRLRQLKELGRKDKIKLLE